MRQEFLQIRLGLDVRRIAGDQRGAVIAQDEMLLTLVV